MKITGGLVQISCQPTVLRNKCISLHVVTNYNDMDANTIIQIISTLGFPIVMCGALFWYMVKQGQSHQEETQHLKDTISENTKVLVELTTLIKALTNGKER